MFNKNKLLLMVSLFVLFTGLQAHAVTVTFGGQAAGDNSGLTSAIGVDTNNVALPGFIIETFDVENSSAQIITTNSGGTIAIDAGGGFNTLIPEQLDVVGGFGIASQHQSYAANPAGDSTSFAYGPGAPNEGKVLPASVRIENEDFTAYDPALFIRYLGLYYGSIDTYNNIAFYTDSENDILLQTDTGFLSDGILEGSEILASVGGNSGNQTQPGSNVYVNLFFEYDEVFEAFEFRTTGVAFELDNVVAGVGPAPVPEPSTFLLLGSGLMGLGFFARRRKK